MAIIGDDGAFYPERYAHELDNRDQGETWLVLEGCHGDYVSVKPEEVMGNMIENCYNEDVLFLFEQFTVYLNGLDGLPGIKDDTRTDHILGFRSFLTKLITSNKTGG